MFLLQSAIKNSRRHWRKSILYLLICAVAVLTLQIYAGNIRQTETQLAELPNAMTITGRVTNSKGSLYSGLEIFERIVDGLIASPYVTDVRTTSVARAGIGDFPVEEWNKYLNLQVKGINTLAAVDGLSDATITWLPGYTPETVQGSEAVCLMDQVTMQENGLKLGDTIPLNLYYYVYIFWNLVTYEPLEIMDCKIVGEVDTTQVITKEALPQVILPFDTMREASHRNDQYFFADSFDFTVANAFELNEFKAEMKELGMRPIDPAASSVNISNGGGALRLTDAAFISAATQLQESLALLNGFLPLLIVALAAIGYFVAYLMIQNRKEEYAVLRLLGMSKAGSTMVYLLEMLMLTVIGGVCGMVISIVTGVGSLEVGLIALGVFFGCFTAGTLIALWNLGRVNVMLALSQAD